jgi:type II secretory pathway pseudopilin PulG
MVALIFMLAILILSMAVAVPRVRESIQRDRDLETMERGRQYIRAVQLYYRKFNSYPPNLDALVKTNNIRFLRKKYIDPTTGKEEWKPIMFGQNKTPMAMGFFGQPLAGAPVAGIGPGGGTGLTGTPTTGGITTPSAGVGLFNSNSSSSTTDAGTNSGTSPSTPTGTSGATPTGGTDANGNPISGTGTTSGTTTNAPGSTPTGTSGTSSSPTTSGQTFGGAGIIGFSPQSPKQSILVYKKKNHYNEWEFLYSPQSDMQTMGGGNTGTIGQPASSTTTPIGGGTTTGTTPTTPATPAIPTAPQQ